MWIAKLKGFDEGNVYGSKTIKNNVSVHYYPTSHYLEKNIYYFIAVGIVEGEENNIKNFFKDLKKENKKIKNKRYIVKLETKGNFFICITAQHKNIETKQYVHLYYNPKFIHISPAIIDFDGHEEWNIACAERKEIEKLIGISEKKYKGKLLLFKETKLNNIGILSVLPNLTEKQKRAFILAEKNGYYEYPRKIELEKLAKMTKVSLSTYQEHLRKAEGQLLPFIMRKFF